MRVSFVIPWRGTDEHRHRDYAHVRRTLLKMTPFDVHLIEVDSGHEPFRRAASRNEGVREALALGVDCVVVCDADTVPERDPLLDAIRQSHDGVLHLPYTRYRALTLKGTKRFMRGADPMQCGSEMDWGLSTGGVFVIHPASWFAAGGMDERFTHWGYEDTAFRIACDVLLGPTVTHPGLLVHLWHPSTYDRGTPEREAGRQLAQRYDAAEGDPGCGPVVDLRKAGGYFNFGNFGRYPLKRVGACRICEFVQTTP